MEAMGKWNINMGRESLLGSGVVTLNDVLYIGFGLKKMFDMTW